MLPYYWGLGAKELCLYFDIFLVEKLGASFCLVELTKVISLQGWYYVYTGCFCSDPEAQGKLLHLSYSVYIFMPEQITLFHSRCLVLTY